MHTFIIINGLLGNAVHLTEKQIPAGELIFHIVQRDVAMQIHYC